MTTISASSSTEIVLSSPGYTNPIVIDPGISIISDVTDGFGVYAATGSWTLQNAGDIAAAAHFGGIGIYLNAGGYVTNQSTGTISGNFAVGGGDAGGLGATLTVSNAGGITGYTWGVALGGGGSVTNQSGGTISGHYGVWGFNGSESFSVVNYGSIAGVTSDAIGGRASGVVLEAAGDSVSNKVSVSITGYIGINANSGADGNSFILNAGVLAGSESGIFAAGIEFTEGASTSSKGGSATNLSTGTISGYNGIYSHSLPSTGQPSTAASTVVNYGGIEGNGTHGDGVRLQSHGGVTNQSGGQISGYYGIYVVNGATTTKTTIVNAGGITGNASGGT
jgi:hypothetical protein